MNAISLRFTSAGLLAACVMITGGCYPAYPPSSSGSAYNGNGGSKDGYAGSEDDYGNAMEAPPQQSPRYSGVDPGLAIAGVAAAGVLGYAIGNGHGHYHRPHYGPYFYRPVFYRPAYGRGHYGRFHHANRYRRW